MPISCVARLHTLSCITSCTCGKKSVQIRMPTSPSFWLKPILRLMMLTTSQIYHSHWVIISYFHYHFYYFEIVATVIAAWALSFSDYLSIAPPEHLKNHVRPSHSCMFPNVMEGPEQNQMAFLDLDQFSSCRKKESGKKSLAKE